MAKDNPHEKHRERVKNQFLTDGFSDNTPPHKILELLLFYSIPRKDTNEIAHALLDRFDSIAGVLEATPDELMSVKGVGPNTAILIKLLIHFFRRYNTTLGVKGVKLNTLDEIFYFIKQKYYGRTEETFAMTTFNGRNEVIAFDILYVGDVNSVHVSRRTVVQKAIERKAAAVVVSHNHPKGDALPSPEDVTVTANLIKALDTVGIPLWDHMIFDEDDGISMACTQQYEYLFRQD